MIVNSLREFISSHNPEMLFAEGFDGALAGLAERCGQPTLAVYDAEKCIEILMQRDGMSEEEAYEFFSFNVSGAWVGPNTPLWFWPAPENVKAPAHHTPELS